MTAARRPAVLLLSSVLLVFSAAASVSPPTDEDLWHTLHRVAAEVSGTRIYDCIDAITRDAPTMYRLMGTPTHQLFLQKYGRVFEEAGLHTQVVHFAEGGPAPQGVELPLRGGDNILGVLPGEDLHRWFVLGGHYDTQLLTQGGAAIDDTSGICATLEIAKAFHKLGLRPHATVVFAWWDGEEWGLYGSRAFVADHNETKALLGLARDAPVEILGAISFDIIGINFPAKNLSPTYTAGGAGKTAVLNLWAPPDDEGNFTLCRPYACYKYDKYSEAQLAAFANYQALVRFVANEFLGLPPAWVQAKDDTYGRSDHMPFTAAGFPGLRVQGSHDGEFPQYHTPLDTLAVAAVMAGGEAALKDGFNAAADVGAVVSAYVALTGGVGEYATPKAVPSAPMDGLGDGGSIPGVSLGVFLGVLTLGLLGRRR